MTKIKYDKYWIEKHKPCEEAIHWVYMQKSSNATTLINKALKEKRFDWVDWALSKTLNKDNRIKWAVFAAEDVLPIFESKYPDDLRPRQAIEAAKACIGNTNVPDSSKPYYDLFRNPELIPYPSASFYAAAAASTALATALFYDNIDQYSIVSRTTLIYATSSYIIDANSLYVVNPVPPQRPLVYANTVGLRYSMYGLKLLKEQEKKNE